MNSRNTKHTANTALNAASDNFTIAAAVNAALYTHLYNVVVNAVANAIMFVVPSTKKQRANY